MRKLTLRCFILNSRCQQDSEELLKLATSISETLEQKVNIQFGCQKLYNITIFYKCSLGLQIPVLLLIDCDSGQVTWHYSTWVFQTFASFLIRFFSYWLSSLYIEISFLSDTCFIDILFQSVGCLFMLLQCLSESRSFLFW